MRRFLISLANIGPNRLFSQWRWHLDEVFVRINGETHYLWRAVDHEGEVRAMEICSQEHAHLRFSEADFVLSPQFPFAIDTLEFSRKRVCIAAGARAVRASLKDLRQLLQKA